MPSLAERLDDIPLLIQYFLKKYNEAYDKQIKGLTRKAQTILYQHAWPGNVRELENVIGHACMMTESDVIDVRDLPDRIQNTRVTENAESEVDLSMDQLARLHAQRVLAHVGGNKVRAAEILGISRTYLYDLLKKSAPQKDLQDAELQDEESKLVAPKAPKGA